MHDPLRATPWTATREGGGRSALYNDLAEELDALLRGETDPVANAANTAAAIYHSLPDLNWVGFYFVRGQELVLGPFQGKPACVRIPLGKGVCGTAAAERRSVLVADVHAFPGHIACDAASRSELVVPLLAKAGLGVRPESLAGRPGGSFWRWERRKLATMSPHRGGASSFPAPKIPCLPLGRPSTARLCGRTLRLGYGPSRPICSYRQGSANPTWSCHAANCLD